MISDEAVEAAYGELPVEALRYVNKARLRAALEAAAPYMLSEIGPRMSCTIHSDCINVVVRPEFT